MIIMLEPGEYDGSHFIRPGVYRQRISLLIHKTGTCSSIAIFQIRTLPATTLLLPMCPRGYEIEPGPSGKA